VTDPIVKSVVTLGDFRYDALISSKSRSCEVEGVVYLWIYVDRSLP
jgi:hypothetical protein